MVYRCRRAIQPSRRAGRVPPKFGGCSVFQNQIDITLDFLFGAVHLRVSAAGPPARSSKRPNYPRRNFVANTISLEDLVSLTDEIIGWYVPGVPSSWLTGWGPICLAVRPHGHAAWASSGRGQSFTIPCC